HLSMYSHGGSDRVVPLAVDLCRADLHGSQFLVRDLDPGGVRVAVEFRLHPQARFRPGVRDQIDDDLVAGQRTATPVDGDLTEQAVLDLVPLARPRWEMADRNGQPQFVRQALQRHLPQPVAAPITPTAV